MRSLKALEKQTMDVLNRIPLSPYPSVAASSLFPTADLVVKDDDESKVDNEVFISLGKCFEKWSEMPDSAENFWKIINAWHGSTSKSHMGMQPQQTILSICLRDIEMGNIDAAMCFLKLCRINGSQVYGVMSMGMFKSLFRLLRPAHRATDGLDDDEMEQDDVETKEVESTENNSMLTELMKEIRSTLFSKDNARIGSEIGLLNSLAETILTNILQYKQEHKLSKMFYKHAGKTLKCIVSSATQVLGTGESGEKETVVTENCADLLVRLLPIVMMVKYGTKGSVVPHDAKETSNISLSWINDLIQLSPSAGGAFLRRACAVVPVRSEFRKIALKTIMRTLTSLPKTIQDEFMRQYLPKYSKVSQSMFRLFAVEMCGEIQKKMSKSTEEEEEEDMETTQTQVLLIRTLLERSCDRIPSVRAAAMRVLGNIAESIVKNDNLSGPWALALIPALRGSASGSTMTPSKKSRRFDQSLLEILRRRLNDINSTVKNAALRLMAAIPGVLGENTEVIPTELVRVAARLATDKSVSTRKRALQLVTALLLRCPSNEEWQTLWLQYVLPGIHDAETTVQNISIEAVDRLILAPLSSSARSKDVDTNSTWLLLRKIPLSSGCQTMLCLQTALRKAPSNRLTPRLLSLLLDTAVKMEKDVNSGISWALLQELVRTTKLQKHFDLDIVVKCFGTTLISIEDDESCSSHPSVIPSTQRMLRIMNDASNLLESAKAMELAAMLLQNLTSFSISAELIHGAVQTIASLCSAHSGPQAVETQRKWCTQVLQRCEDTLTGHLRNVDSEDETVIRALVTLGEVALIYAMGSDAIVKKLNRTKNTTSPCQSGVTYVARATSVQTNLERLFRPVQAYVAPKPNCPVALSVRAQAFVAFGKLCLCDQSLARRCITVLIRELDTTKEPVLRNNILIILSDLCREHTALVDPYISNMAYCLMDEHAGVRRHALMLITELLLQSFVKLRGPILYLLLSTMLDSDPETAEAAQHAILEVFSKRDPTLIPTYFVETMFVMNACKDHSKYNVHDERLEILLASFYGSGEATLKRRSLYELMLSSMSNENKIRITARLCQDILGNVVDGVIKLSDHTQAVSLTSPVSAPTPSGAVSTTVSMQRTLSFEHADFYLIQDTFAILCSDAARVHTTSDGTAQVQEEVIENAEAAASAAKNKLLSKIAHKNALQNVVPIIVSLKRQLERIHSPLLKSVMSYFSFLFRFHRRELDKALAEDPTVASEIQYDLRKMDEQEKEEEEKRRLSLSTNKKSKKTPRSSIRTAKKMRKCPTTSRKDLQRLSVPRVRGTPKSSNKVITQDEEKEDLSSCVRTLDTALAPLTNVVDSASPSPKRRSLRQKTKLGDVDEDVETKKPTKRVRD